jgi:hypothetical protein
MPELKACVRVRALSTTELLMCFWALSRWLEPIIYDIYYLFYFTQASSLNDECIPCLDLKMMEHAAPYCSPASLCCPAAV